MRVYYLEIAQAIRVSIGFSIGLGPNNPQTQAKKNLLQTNIERMGIRNEPWLKGSLISTTSNSFFHQETYFSSDLCYLFKLDNFSSLDNIKNDLLQGFSQVPDYPQDLQYCFDSPKDENNLTAYFNPPLLIEDIRDTTLDDEIDPAQNPDLKNRCCVLS